MCYGYKTFRANFPQKFGAVKSQFLKHSPSCITGPLHFPSRVWNFPYQLYFPSYFWALPFHFPSRVPTFCANFQLQFRFFTASIPFVFCASSSWSSSTGSSTSRLTSSSASRRTSSSASRRMSSSASSRMSCPTSIRHSFSSAYWDQSGTWLCFQFSQDIL